MRQAMEWIIETVRVIIGRGDYGTLDTSESGLKSLLDAFTKETEAIRLQLVNYVFSGQKQSEVESLIQNYQSVLIKLLDELYTFRGLDSVNDNEDKLYSGCSNLLLNLLFFIEKYFSRYFNLDEKVPCVYYLMNKQWFEQQSGDLILVLNNKGLEKELVTILFSALASNNSNRNKEITYRELIYLKEYLGELKMVTEIMNGKQLPIEIRNLLVYLNYNDASFISNTTKEISKEVGARQSLQEKILELKFQQKEFKQINCRPGVGLRLELMSAKEQIVSWIEEEMNYLIDEAKMLKQPGSAQEEIGSEVKLNTSLSVPQLAYFIRLLVEGKIITNSNQTEVLKFVAANFTTLKRENISYGHLRSQYYKFEAPAIENIKDLLLRLVNLSRKLK